MEDTLRPSGFLLLNVLASLFPITGFVKVPGFATGLACPKIKSPHPMDIQISSNSMRGSDNVALPIHFEESRIVWRSKLGDALR